MDPNAQSCLKPPSLTNVKFVVWGVPVSAAIAPNSGQYCNSFQVVIAGRSCQSLEAPPDTEAIQAQTAITQSQLHLQCQDSVVLPHGKERLIAQITPLAVKAHTLAANSSASVLDLIRFNTSQLLAVYLHAVLKPYTTSPTHQMEIIPLCATMS